MSEFDRDPLLSRFVSEYILRELPEEVANIESPDVLNMLGTAYCKRFEQEQNYADLEKGLVALEKAVRLAERPSNTWRYCVNNLGNALQMQFVHTRDQRVLDRAISYFGQLTEHTPPDASDLPEHLHNLCSCLLQRYNLTHDLSDVDRAIRAWQEIRHRTQPTTPHRQMYLENLITGLRMRHTLTNNYADLNEANQVCKELLQELAPSDPERGTYVEQLTQDMVKYYRHTGHKSDLRDAIRTWERLIDQTPEGAEYLPALTNFQSFAYLERFTQTDDEDDLEQAISLQERALSLCAPDSFYLSQCQYNLGNGLFLRYEHQGPDAACADLDRAIALIEDALTHVSSRDERMPDVYRSMLVKALRRRFERTENLADLERAQSLTRKIRPGFAID